MALKLVDLYALWLEQVGEEADHLESDSESVSTEGWYPSVQLFPEIHLDDSSVSDGFFGACDQGYSAGVTLDDGTSAGIPLERIGELESEIHEIFGSDSSVTGHMKPAKQWSLSVQMMEGKLEDCSSAEHPTACKQACLAHTTGLGNCEARHTT